TGTTTPTPLHSGTALAGVSIVAYPNPFSEEMSLSITAPSTVPMFVKVLDMKGQVVMESEAYTTNQLITLGKDFPAGLYLIEAVLNGELKTMKISKQ
ncbi:MAG: T9SS type A sorting domain-containing protein, partial [Cytophagaceae bacterium]